VQRGQREIDIQEKIRQDVADQNIQSGV
jgi:hypothetical protein